LSLEPQSTSSQSSSLTLEPCHSLPGRPHENIPSATLTGSSFEHPNVDLLVTMLSPAPTHGNLVEHRRENRIALEIEIRPRSVGSELPWDCIRIPRTKSVQRPAVLGNRNTLDFRLEVQGATTGTVYTSLCERCTEKESRNSTLLPRLVDFTSKTNIIDLKSGKAQVTFRFLCLSTHHGVSDSEYRITAVISNGDQVIARHTLEALLRVTSRGTKTKPVKSAGAGTILDSARPPEDRSQVLGRDTTRNLVPSTSTSGTTSAIDLLPHASSFLPSTQWVPSPIGLRPATQHWASNTVATDGEDYCISLLSPPSGTTSGGEQIVLILVNLPPSITLFARFGDNVVATSYHAPGVLVCNLPPAAQPGTVEVTLSRTPSLNAPACAKSPVKFAYESDADRAATHILRIRDQGLRSEAMPFIHRVLQSSGSRGQMTSNSMPQASSSRRSDV